MLRAIASLNRHGAAPMSASTALSLKQKALTTCIDGARWERLLASSTVVAQAVLRSESDPGGRAFLAAVPTGRKFMEPAAFVGEVRDLLCSWAERAGLQPEREKPGLLLPQRPEDSGLARRRPADIYVPSYLGSPVAFDLAVTGPQRQETLGAAARKSLAAATAYADVKRAHQDTASVCQAQGVRFLPLVVETTGAWEPEAASVLQHISRAAAARESADPAALHGELLQELSITVRSFRARAVLRRRAEMSEAAALGPAQSAAAGLLAVT